VRISFRVLIAVVLAVGTGLGWLVRSARVQRDSVAAIQRTGASVSYDWEWRDGKPSPSNAVPPWQKKVRKILGPDLFSSPVAVWLGIRAKLADDALMVHVGRLSRLEYLSLFDTAVSDVGLARLRALTRLKTLHLAHEATDDADHWSGSKISESASKHGKVTANERPW